MRGRRDSLVVVAWALLLCLPIAARGEILVFAMEGTVNSVRNPLGLFDFVDVNDRVTYTFAFDSNAPDLSSLPDIGAYRGLWSTLRVGGDELATGLPGMTVGVGATDGLDLESNFMFQGYFGSLYFRLGDYDGAAISDPSLPSVPYQLAMFEAAHFSVTVLGPSIPPSPYPSEHQFYGSIDGFYLIPEPCSLLLLATGGLGFTARVGNARWSWDAVGRPFASRGTGPACITCPSFLLWYGSLSRDRRQS